MRTKNCLQAAALLALLLQVPACTEPSPSEPGGPTPVPVASVQVDPGTSSIAPGQTLQLNAKLLDGSGGPLSGRTVTWSTSQGTIAQVGANGLVTALAAGTATITATSEGKSGNAQVTVVAGPPVASVTITTPLDSLEAFDVRTLQAVLRDANGNVLTGRPILWTSSDPAVATIDPATGVLTGVDRGTVTITATSEGKTASVTRVVVIRYRSISAGTMHACDIASGGVVWCWGLNGRQGRIGEGKLADDEFSAIPVRLQGSHRFTQLATYGVTTCGIAAQGATYCWGGNSWGALGTGASTPAQSFTPVAVTGGHSFKQIVAGAGHLCGLTTGGKAYCWGTNGDGELGNGLRASSSAPVGAAANLTFQSLTAGSGYTCGITTAGPTYCWGYDGLGNLGDGRPISYGNTYSLAPVRVAGDAAYTRISAGQYHTCAVTAAGVAHCWGRNGGRLGTGSHADTSSPLPVAGGLTFRSISAGFAHSCGVTPDDQVYCWGANGNGQLGLVMQNGSTSPVRVSGNLMAAEVSAANVATGFASYTCAISPDRLTTRCWGRNDVGQLGNGTTTHGTVINATPTIVQGQKPL